MVAPDVRSNGYIQCESPQYLRRPNKDGDAASGVVDYCRTMADGTPGAVQQAHRGAS